LSLPPIGPIGDGPANFGEDSFGERVAFWVNCGLVERLVAAKNSEEAGGLDERRVADP
jgi:hypothetical protein